MSEPTAYTVTWKEKGKAHAEPFTDYLAAESRARELSLVRGVGAVLIESRVRYVHARWENGTQTLSRSLALMAGMEL